MSDTLTTHLVIFLNLGCVIKYMVDGEMPALYKVYAITELELGD